MIGLTSGSVLVEAMWPNKTDAVAYLDGDAAIPTKYAHVLLSNRASEEPTYADILVGPLPIDNTTTAWEPLEYPYTKKSGGTVRNLDADSGVMFMEWIFPIAASIADITLDLFNGTATGEDNDTMAIWGIDPMWQDDGRVVRFDAFWNIDTNFDAGTLLPLGLYFLSDVTGRDPSKWKLEGWFYAPTNTFYSSTEEFRKAWESEDFVKYAPNVGGGQYSSSVLSWVPADVFHHRLVGN